MERKYTLRNGIWQLLGGLLVIAIAAQYIITTPLAINFNSSISDITSFELIKPVAIFLLTALIGISITILALNKIFRKSINQKRKIYGTSMAISFGELVVLGYFITINIFTIINATTFYNLISLVILILCIIIDIAYDCRHLHVTKIPREKKPKIKKVKVKKEKVKKEKPVKEKK